MKKLIALFLAALMLLSCMPVLAESESGSTIRISFDFKNRDAADLDQLNALLAAMPLTWLELENSSGYLCTTTRYAPDGETLVDVTLRYGLDVGELVCTLPDAMLGEEGHIFQIGQEVFPADAAPDSQTFWTQWFDENPEYQIRTLITISYDTHIVFLYLYHARTFDN